MKLDCFFKEDFKYSLYGILAQPFAVGVRNIVIGCSEKQTMKIAAKRLNPAEIGQITKQRKIIHFVVGVTLIIPIINTIILLVARLFKNSFQNKLEQKIINEEPAQNIEPLQVPIIPNTNSLPVPITAEINPKQKANPLPVPITTELKANPLPVPAKIKLQQRKERVVGVSKLKDGTLITLKKAKDKYETIIFKAFANSKELGHIKFDWRRWMSNGIYGSGMFPDGIALGGLAKYGPNTITYMKGNREYNLTGMVSKIYVDDLLTNVAGKGKGVGTALMQAAMEYGYQKGCRGRIQLMACWSSHVFYYGLGMRLQIKDEKLSAQIAQVYMENKINNTVKETDFGGHMMYMPQVGIRKMGEKIRQNPILFKTQTNRVALASRQRTNSFANLPSNLPKRRKSI